MELLQKTSGREGLEELARKYFLLIDQGEFPKPNGSMLGWMQWNLQKPDEKVEDIHSVVCLVAPLDKYTDEELAKLIEISIRVNEQYEQSIQERGGYKMTTNLWYINKNIWQYGDSKGISWAWEKTTWDIAILAKNFEEIIEKITIYLED